MDIVPIFTEGLIALKNILIAFLVSWFEFFVSPRRKNISDEIILVTGAASGMGRAMLIEFAKLGAQTVAWDVNIEGLVETADMVKAIGGKCCWCYCDISDREQVKKSGEQVRRDVGEVTMLINSAGVVHGKKLVDLTDVEIEKTLGVNLMGQIWTTKHFLPSMLENNHGHIVNMGSSAGLVGLCRLVDYSTSKFGITGFTETLNYELHFGGYDGVYTTLISPAFVKTGMFSGCKQPYPWLLPDLEPEPTVKRIMQAILTNQTHLCLPRQVYFLFPLKHLIPADAFLEICRFFRAHTFMDSFVGRKSEGDTDVHKEE